MSATVKLYAVFHLNLAYSSIDEEQHATVVERCYHPLLDLAERLGLPIGVEATAHTLEAARAADPGWLDRLRALVTDGPCELIGAGYAQIIGPLVPADVNRASLRLGDSAYEALLGVRPTIVYVNEQAYSAGMLGLYLDAGYEAIFMEWDNAARHNPAWHSEWRYHPQIAQGQGGERMPVLWNLSAAFQKLQRYAHGELDLSGYLAYVEGQSGSGARAFPLYGSDAEVFDFRPGRYQTEAYGAHDEWARIGQAVERLLEDPRYELVSPSQVLLTMSGPDAGHELRLETPELPVPVKKQGKYNLTRWAVTGRADTAVNTRCRRFLERMRQAGASDDDWRTLCRLWASDFRTHITDGRWEAYLEELRSFEDHLGVGHVDREAPLAARVATSSARVERKNRTLEIETQAVRVEFSLRRGLTIRNLTFPGISEDALVGTLEHGYFDDINMTADYYTGHVVLERSGAHKVTDLSPVEPEVEDASEGVLVKGAVDTPLGPVRKSILVHHDTPRIELTYDLDWEDVPSGSLRVGNVTLLPENFRREALWYATNNGGGRERFGLAGHDVEHGAPVSLLVTASTCVGLTEGIVEMGDDSQAVHIEVDQASATLVGLITHKEVGDSFFCRCSLSVLEADETRKPELADIDSLPGPIRISVCAEAT